MDQAIDLLDSCKAELNNFLQNLENDENKNKYQEIIEKNKNIKLLQENYADSFSKNSNVGIHTV